MAELAVWSGVSITMLLIMLAVISSTALLFGAISAMGGQHAGTQGIVAMSLALIAAAVNFVIVQRAGLSMANITREKPMAMQARYGQVFCIIIFLWAACAGLIGFWMVRLVRSFL
jgi:hypothetical protein